MNMQGKTVVVTGGGSGMGRELVLLLLQKGASVAAVDINETALNETADLAGANRERLSLHCLNITDREAVLALPEAVIQKHGAVDALINNAGIIQKFVRINDLEFKDMERVFNVNFWGVANMTKAFLPYLLKRPEAYIANTSSMGGFLPVPGQTVYGASKAAVGLFTDGLHAELLDTNVRVSGIYPGAIATNISLNSGVDTRQMESAAGDKRMKTTGADEAARIILDGMENNLYHIMVGSDAKMMNRFQRLAPERAMKMISSKMGSLLPKMIVKS